MNELEKLHDIHLPQAVTFWPPAIGWWILFSLAALLLIAAYLFWRYHYQPMRYKRQALKTLEHIQFQHPRMTDQQYADTIARLIRQTALARHPELASLQGSQWRDFLAENIPQDIADKLAIDRYRPAFSIDRERLYLATKQWIRGLT